VEWNSVCETFITGTYKLFIMVTFKELKLSHAILKAVEKKGYTIPTPIQLQSIPGLLEGKDLIGIAQTGTGKTAAFVIPVLQRMKEEYPRKVRTLVLAPTRELVAQIGESFSDYGQLLKFKNTVIFGGVPQGKQVRALSNGVDIVVATPGRLLDLMNQGKINFRDLKFFILDEADRMLDMGFINDIKKIIAKVPHKRQSMFFSATMPPQINALAKTFLKNPVHVEVTPQAKTVDKIDQCIFFVDAKSKEKLLLKLMNDGNFSSVLIFTRTKHKANKVALFLNKNGVAADAIHGNKSQNQRTSALKGFKEGKIKVLVATDIAARGIDIDNISHIINFELPNEPESYVHRIGRTARAGKAGTAFSFCSAEERNFLHDIERLIKQNINVEHHDFHSQSAEHAKGADAKPPPKQFNRGGRSGNRKGSSGHRKGSKPNSGYKGKPGHRSKQGKKSFSRRRR